MKRLRWLVAGSLVLVLCVSHWQIAVGQSSTDDAAEQGIDVVDRVGDLESLFADHQVTFLPIGPPSEAVFVQGFSQVVPVD